MHGAACTGRPITIDIVYIHRYYAEAREKRSKRLKIHRSGLLREDLSSGYSTGEIFPGHSQGSFA